MIHYYGCDGHVMADTLLAFRAGPLAATLLGMLTGIGGGMESAALVREIPAVLCNQFDAVAALLGAGVAVFAAILYLPRTPGLLPAQHFVSDCG